MDRSRTNHIRATAVGDRLYLSGDHDQEIALRQDGFFKEIGGFPSQRMRDLLRIAAAVYGVDRCVRRESRDSQQSWIRDLHLIVGVRDVGFWAQASVREKLQEIVSFLSDDDWALELEEDTSDLLPLTEHYPLPLRLDQPVKVALYSGGLDSAAGLALQSQQLEHAYQLVTVIHQSSLHRLVLEQVQELRKRTGAVIVPAFLTVHLRGGCAKRLSFQEQTQRCRGLLFGSAAAVAAGVSGASSIEVFENGVGALNVPLMTGMLSGGRATRGAHPNFMRLMSDLVSLIAERPIRYSLPFQKMTKAEMVCGVAANRLQDWMLRSKSCIHTSLRLPGKHHCGVCPACLGRRQAFITAGVAEHLDDYGCDVFSASPESLAELDRAYLRLEVLSARELQNGSDSPALKRVQRHFLASQACDSASQQQGWFDVLQRHAKEWCDLADRRPAVCNVAAIDRIVDQVVV